MLVFIEEWVVVRERPARDKQDKYRFRKTEKSHSIWAMKEVMGKRRSQEVMDGGKRRAGADSRLLMMKSSVWCASVDPLMKGKQQHAFPSLALISPLSGGSVVSALRRRLDGGRRSTDWAKKVWKRRKTKGEGGGGRLFKLCCWEWVYVKIIWTSSHMHQFAHTCGCFDFRAYA